MSVRLNKQEPVYCAKQCKYKIKVLNKRIVILKFSKDEKRIFKYYFGFIYIYRCEIEINRIIVEETCVY